MANDKTPTDRTTIAALACLRPIHDWNLVRPLDAYAEASGLVRPESYSDDTHGADGDLIREFNQLCLAEVLAVGPGEKLNRNGRRVQPDIEVGDLVMYHRADATPLEGFHDVVLVRGPAIWLAVQGNVRQVVGGLVEVDPVW